MEEITTNTGIYFSGTDTLKSDGWIKVYDAEKNTLLKTFTANDWKTYTSSNPYKYETPVKHVRVETSRTNASSYFYVYNVKELDDEYITTNIAAKLPDRRYRMAFFMLLYTVLPLATALTIVAKLSSASIMEAASLETSVPVIPIATPMSDFFNAGASLTPSPVIATILPLRCHASTIRILFSGETLA